MSNPGAPGIILLHLVALSKKKIPLIFPMISPENPGSVFVSDPTLADSPHACPVVAAGSHVEVCCTALHPQGNQGTWEFRAKPHQAKGL